MEKVLGGSGLGIEGRTQGYHLVCVTTKWNSNYQETATKICVLSFLGSLTSNSLPAQGTSYQDLAGSLTSSSTPTPFHQLTVQNLGMSSSTIT